MICYLILPFFEFNTTFEKNSVICGVDYGSILALKNNIKLDYAIGDFDSVNVDDFNKLSQSNTKIIKLQPEKDDTDTEHAINFFKDYEQIIVCGGLKGNRIDHLIANINLAKKYDNVIFKDNDSVITNIKNFNKIDYKDYFYVSFFLEENSCLTLKGFKYNLDNYQFKKLDNLCISNEIINNPQVSFIGNGIVIFSKLDNSNLQK